MEEFCRKHGVQRQTHYGWRKCFGGLDPSDVLRLRSLAQLERTAQEKKAPLADENLAYPLKAPGTSPWRAPS